MVAVLVCVAGSWLQAGSVHAEPYLAVQQGYKCMSCHVNPTGGGMRNSFGEIFSQNVLPAQKVDVGADAWDGTLNRWIMLGGDVRANWTSTDVPNQKQTNEFDLSDARVYLNVEAIPGRLSAYFDERLAPGDATNMEAYARYWSAGHTWFVQAGRMYLPFGLRLED